MYLGFCFLGGFLCEVGTDIMIILQVRKLGPREV